MAVNAFFFVLKYLAYRFCFPVNISFLCLLCLIIGMSIVLSGIGSCIKKTENCTSLQTTADAPATEKNCPYDNALRCKKLSCAGCVADNKCVFCDTLNAGLSSFSRFFLTVDKSEYSS